MNPLEIVASAFELDYCSDDECNQDWDLFVADSGKIREFLDGYDCLPNRDAKHALIRVILASFEGACIEKTLKENDWLEFWSIIKFEIECCSFWLAYWAQRPTIGELVNEQLTRSGYVVTEDGLSLARIV